jgi:DNA-binding NarL/FixJ family response regulator
MKDIRILIVEDHKLIRETWISMLNMDSRFDVMAACGNTFDAVAIAEKEKPDIILMDINIHPLNGFEATAKLKEICPDCKVIALSFHNEMLYVQKMFSYGAKGYLTKNSGCEEMIDAIYKVYEGKYYVCAEIREKGFQISALSRVKNQFSEILTNKEIQISHYLQDGLKSKEIAGKMNISVRTVSVHRYNIYKKLKVNNSVLLLNALNSKHMYKHYSTPGVN